MSSRPVVTSQQGFFRLGSGQPMAIVSAGVPAADALEHASCLIASITDLAAAMGDGGLSNGGAFAIQQLAETAKALIDAAAIGCSREALNL